MEVKRCDSTIIAGIDQLPEEILSHVISLTTPHDACVFSSVSRAFQSAADSDATWQHFLPSDYSSFLSHALRPLKYASKKELYFRLCNHPCLLYINHGLMSFGLEKSTGAKIFMISARKLMIVGGYDRRYWEWAPDRRFHVHAVLLHVGITILDISGKLNSKILTPNTSYAAYLIFKLTEDSLGLDFPLQETKVALSGDTQCRKVCLNPAKAAWKISENVVLPRQRQDAWLEVELGVFHSRDGINGDIIMSFRGTTLHQKTGLIVQGIEVRPQH